MSLKEFIIDTVPPEKYYKSRFPKWIPKTNVPCVFHSDRSPSLSLALDNGGARCHAAGCGKRVGNIVHFEAEAEGITEVQAAERLYKEFIRPILPLQKLRKFKEELGINGLLLLKIRKEMGLSPYSIRRFQLGFDAASSRITIPIWDQWGHCVNVRYYKLPSERQGTTAKIYNHEQGYGSVDLFPWPEALKFKANHPIYFMASEKEAMLMLHYGHNAVCSTAGEGSYNPQWNSFFYGREVRIIFDRDAGGTVGAGKLRDLLLAAGVKKVSIIPIPFKQKRPDHKDFADWVIKQKGNPKELETVEEEAESPVVDLLTPELPSSEGGEIMISDIGTKPRLLNLKCKAQGIVASKAPSTFSVPWKFKIEIRKKPAFVYTVPMGRQLLRFVRANDDTILQSLQKLLSAKQIKVDIVETITVTEVEIIPIAAIDKDIPYVVQRCFYFGEKIEANIPYSIEVIPVTEVRTQEIVGIITKVEPISIAIDSFTLTPEIEAELTTTFQPGDFESAWEKLEKTSEQIALNYTRVYNRFDWHLVALLTWVSPIGWNFPGEEDQLPTRGWLNSLALGDTETGKSKVCKALQQIFNCGVFVNAENCTYVGLVGGAIKAGSGQLMLRWGRIPLSDRQLVVLEELSGLSVEEISNMSEVRSSGIARLDKGGINSQTNSRTRLLCLSNVRSQHRTLSGYLFGVKAIQELIGHGEDIARFDLITTLVDNEVDIGIINRRNDFAMIANEEEDNETFKDVISVESLRILIQFIWSLNPKQVKFTQVAYNECLDQTKRLAGIYHPAIPIFKGGSGRYKLGRIAAAIACFQFSWHSDHISVTQAHVIAAARLLELIYKKESFGYKEFSAIEFDKSEIKDGKELELLFKASIQKTKTLIQTLEAIVHETRFSREELQTMAGLPSIYADRLLSRMYLSRAIRKGQGPLYDVTPIGKVWIEDFIKQLKKNKHERTNHQNDRRMHGKTSKRNRDR